MTRAGRSARGAGWLLAGGIAVGLIGSAAAFALAAERRDSVLMLDLAVLPPAAPAIAAIAEAAPDVASAPPPVPEDTEEAETGPVVPEDVVAPTLAAPDLPPPPKLDSAVAADLSLPPPKPKAEPEPEPEPKPKAEKKPEKKRKVPVETAKAPEAPAEEAAPKKKAAPTAEASAPSAGSKAKGGGMSPAAYAKAVLKKVRATKKKSGAGKGSVVVGFSIKASGALGGVQVLQSSGNAKLDQVALDHIRRSAPFPAPPPEAEGRGYSFEFIGK